MVKIRACARVMLLFLFSTVSPYEGTLSNLGEMCVFAESFCASAVFLCVGFLISHAESNLISQHGADRHEHWRIH